MGSDPDVVDLTGDEDVEDAPNGVVKRVKLTPVEQSILPFQLLRTRGIPSKFNDPQLGLGFDMEKAVAGDIRFAFISNYLIDPVFLVSTFPDLLFCDTVIVAHGMKDPSQHEMLRRSLTSALAGVDVSVNSPPVPPYGTHHSKLFFLQYERGIRIIIHTANLVYVRFVYAPRAVVYPVGCRSFLWLDSRPVPSSRYSPQCPLSFCSSVTSTTNPNPSTCKTFR